MDQATKCLKKLSSITCSSKIDCTCEDVNSQCSSNQCVCLSGYKLNDDGTITDRSIPYEEYLEKRK